MPDLKARIMADTDGKPGKALIIVPNQRPWRYFAELFVAENATLMLPKMLPFIEIVSIWRRFCFPEPVYPANTLDQISLLWECIQNVVKKDPLIGSPLAKLDLPAFLPWGFRLARLLEEMFTQGSPGRDIAATEGDVAELAANLLDALGAIAGSYRKLLLERNYATPGLDCFLAQTNAEKIPPFLLPGRDRPVYIAGFSTLNGAQQKLFHSLWQAGARICLHADPSLAKGAGADWACADLTQWINDWHAATSLATPAGKNKPEYHFYAAYDSHSQLKAMVRDLAQADASAAVVLQDASLLMPTLHHLPDANVNISMGYPLARTPLHSFLEDIFQLLLRKRPAGEFYWRDFQRFIHHPMLTMLETPEGVAMRPIVNKLDQMLRESEKFINIRIMIAECESDFTDAEATLLGACLDIFLTALENAKTPLQLAQAVNGICEFLLENGQQAFHKFPLDMETLVRIANAILPILAQNALAEQDFDLSTLHQLLEMLIEQERIPFEADPLVGMQILGMLETRLLHFNDIFILDASDDVLPGPNPQDPLLPDSLRPLAGLPDSHSRHMVTAYTLFRICQNAKNVHFYWAEGSVPAALDTARKRRSRYVERLIWDLEQTRGKLLIPGEDGLETARSQAILRVKKPDPIVCGAKLETALQKLLHGRLSASLLNDYLICPLKFCKKRLLRFALPKEVNEGDDPLIVGDCVHATLHGLLLPFLKQYPFAADNYQKIKSEINNRLAEQIKALELHKKLPVGSFLYFEAAAPRILSAYLNRAAEENPDVLLLDLEKEVAITMDILGQPRKLFGRIDRIDERNGQTMILDYKTGKKKTINRQIWTDATFFDALEDACADQRSMEINGLDLMAKIRENLTDLQLPFYMLLAHKLEAANAGFIYLRDKGSEEMLFEADAEKSICRKRCAALIAFILRRMESSRQFEPILESCAYCDFNQFCGV